MRRDDMEKLAIAQSVFNVVGGFVSTKSHDSFRSVMDEQVISEFENDGIKSRNVMVNGEKVGTYVVNTSKEKVVEDSFISDPAAFSAWVAVNPELATQFAMARSVEFAQLVIDETGELPDGVDIQKRVIPARVKGTTLKVDERKVAEAMGSKLPGAVIGLLGGDIDGD